MIATLKAEDQSQLQLVEREEMDDEEDLFEAIDKLISQGIAAGDVKKLQNANIFIYNGLMMHTKKNLTGIKRLSETKVNKICEAAEIVNFGYITGSDALVKRKSGVCIITGSQTLDELLGGGIETMAITESFGEFRPGKTQLAHTLCVLMRFPMSLKGGNGKVAYRPDRIMPIIERFGMDPGAVLDNIIFARDYTYEHQYNLLLELAAKMSEEPLRFLIVVDSVIALFRVDFTGRGELADRQLPTSMKGGNRKVAYINTEGTFHSRPDRIVPIAERFGMDPGAVLDNACTYEHQYNLLLGLAAKMSEEPFRILIVLDSVIALFRVDFTGRGELADRQQKLAQMVSRLIKSAEKFNVAVYMTNQVIGGYKLADYEPPSSGSVQASNTDDTSMEVSDHTSESHNMDEWVDMGILFRGFEESNTNFEGLAEETRLVEIIILFHHGPHPVTVLGQVNISDTLDYEQLAHIIYDVWRFKKPEYPIDPYDYRNIFHPLPGLGGGDLVGGDVVFCRSDGTLLDPAVDDWHSFQEELSQIQVILDDGSEIIQISYTYYVGTSVHEVLVPRLAELNLTSISNFHQFLCRIKDVWQKEQEEYPIYLHIPASILKPLPGLNGRVEFLNKRLEVMEFLNKRLEVIYNLELLAWDAFKSLLGVRIRMNQGAIRRLTSTRSCQHCSSRKIY